jgi:hypothetical protein
VIQRVKNRATVVVAGRLIVVIAGSRRARGASARSAGSSFRSLDA